MRPGEPGPRADVARAHLQAQPAGRLLVCAECAPTSAILDAVGIDDVMAAEWQRGWHSSDKFICVHCIGDDHLRDVVARAATEDEECSFCGGTPAAEFDVFMEAFMVGVNNRFKQADDAGMPWEKGYVFETFDQDELPDKFDWVAAGEHDDAVADEIRDRLAENLRLALHPGRYRREMAGSSPRADDRRNQPAGRLRDGLRLAWALGVVFQYFTIVPMRNMGKLKGIWAAIKADTLSIVAFQAGLFAGMAIYQRLIFPPGLPKTTPTYWR